MVSPPARPTVLPRWFTLVLTATLALVVALGGVGLALAVAGIYRPARALPIGGAVAIVLFALGWRRAVKVTADEPEGAGRRAGHVGAVLAIALAVGFIALNVGYTGEHVLINRDPAVYGNTGRWLVTHGSLEVDVSQGPFAASEPGIMYRGPGFYHRGDADPAYFQFNHLLPVLLAEAHRVGGESLFFRVPVVLTAIGLLAVYALALRLTGRAWAALAAVATFAVSLPLVSVARDLYSETATLLLLWGGLWLWTRAVDEHSGRVALLAGLVVGATTLTRIDALAYVVPIPLALAALLAHRDRRGKRLVGAFVVGVVPMVALGTTDLRLRSPKYLRDLGTEATLLWVALGATTALAVLWLVLRPRLPALVRWVADRRRQLGWWGAAAVVVVLALAWFVRPHVEETTRSFHGNLVPTLQRIEGEPIDPDRSYEDRSMHWHVWYLGPVVTGAAVLGAGLVARRLVVGGDRALLLPIGVLGFGAALYLYRAAIFPDHIWVMRRFVPASLPLFAALAAVTAAVVVGAISRSRLRFVAPIVALGFAAGAVVPAGATTWPVREAVNQDRFLALPRRVCEIVDGGAMLVVANTSAHKGWSVALRSWCEVPVAVGRRQALSTPQLASLARAWRAEGRTLWLVADTPEQIQAVLPRATPMLAGPIESDRFLHQTLTRPPHAYVTAKFSMALAPVAVG